MRLWKRELSRLEAASRWYFKGLGCILISIGPDSQRILHLHYQSSGQLGWQTRPVFGFGALVSIAFILAEEVLGLDQCVYLS